ncbi:hypothetical protein [Edwardsiella tarda]|uniref:hypothetical protein n=1 Tax=Edwardsiella tarda TaxID=636 RepID=UPI0002DED880|nr:hypothetical protein [Edwardsiella tarda]
MKKLKPLKSAEREIIRQLATLLVCADIEASVIAKCYEDELGKPYDRNAPDGYLNTFLNSDPTYKRLWALLQKDIVTCRKELAVGLGRERGQ